MKKSECFTKQKKPSVIERIAYCHKQMQPIIQEDLRLRKRIKMLDELQRRIKEDGEA